MFRSCRAPGAPVLVIALTLLVPGRVEARPASSSAGDTDVIVTASRLEQPIDSTPASVTVIRRADIERAQARSVEELLAGVEGLAVAGGGGLGKATSVFVRGAESDHTLWLVDGVRVGSVTLGTPSLQDLPIDTIERIEIVRGPRSSLYGADAIGGVVQVFTRRGRSAAPSLRLTGGSNGTRQGAAAVGFGSDALWVDLQASHLQTDGIDSCRGLPFPPGGGCFIAEPDRDPYRNTSGNLRAGWRVSPSLDVQGFVQRTEGRGKFDGSFVNESEVVNQVAGLEVAGRFADRWSSKLKAGRSWDELTSFRNGTQRSVFDTRRDSATWQNDVAVGTAGQLVVGLDWLQDRVVSSTRFVADSRWNRAAFVQYQSAVGRHEFGVAARVDDNQQFGSNATGSVSWGLGLGDGLHVYASAGTAFKAPSFNELYFPGFGNPVLDPEKAQTLEVGVKKSATWGRWTVAAFDSDVDDLIAFDSATFLPQNIARARLAGIEGSLLLRRAGWRFEQSLTWLDAEDRSPGASRGRELPRRPSLSGRSTLGWSDERWDLGVSAQFAGRRFDDLANRQALGGYAVVDLTGGWRLSASTELQLRFANVFDRQYETAYLYPSLGREAFVTVRYRAP